ncbi:MAG TPA: hypothetical protein VD971_08050 [Phycisphaerales bacterium]|nr:hypothetical protein [Phycisphaerales bacterium]
MHADPTQRAAPLWSVLIFTFLNSVGTGVATSGIFFIAQDGYGFTQAQNFALGVLQGLTYVPAALLAGPLLRRLRSSAAWLSERGVLVCLMVGMGLLAAAPALVRRLAEPGAAPAQWPIWALVALYTPLTGLLWPIVESFLSGGKSGAALRRDIGVWNVVWSSALVFAYWGISPLIKDTPEVALLGLGVVQFIACACLVWFPAHAPEHGHVEREPHPPVYKDLLRAFRVLLPLSYLALSALSPYLASLMGRLGVDPSWRTFTVSAWLAPRVIAFVVLGRWGAWHGRWWTALFGAAGLVLGFGLCVGAGVSAGSPAALPLMVLGLVVFGLAMGTIYCGAIYYAMEVGDAALDAGGVHEALIGAGYMIGPSCGLLAIAGVKSGLVPTKGFDAVLLAVVGAFVVLGSASVLARGRKGDAILTAASEHDGHMKRTGG